MSVPLAVDQATLDAIRRDLAGWQNIVTQIFGDMLKTALAADAAIRSLTDAIRRADAVLLLAGGDSETDE